jgi:predicted nucleic-acid-binding Zn-ribbon protein
MTREQAEKIDEWFAARGGRSSCPGCGSQELVPGDIIIGIKYQKGGLDDWWLGIPMAEIVCEKCCYVSLYAVDPMGLEYR